LIAQSAINAKPIQNNRVDMCRSSLWFAVPALGEDQRWTLLCNLTLGPFFPSLYVA